MKHKNSLPQLTINTQEAVTISDESSSDCCIIISVLVLGILGGLLIGVPLTIMTGYPQYIRLFFFLGIAIGGALATGVFVKHRR